VKRAREKRYVQSRDGSGPGMGATDLAEIYDQHAPVVYGLARRVTGSREASEEITQDVFLRLWRDDSTFDAGRGSMRSWLCMVGHGLAVSWVRREMSQRDRLLRTHETEASGWMLQQSPVELDAEAQADAVAVRASLLALSKVQREALSLVYFDGLTHRELAEVQGIPLGTAKSRVRDSLRHLSQLQSYDIESDRNRSGSCDHRSTDDGRSVRGAAEKESLAESLARLAVGLAARSMYRAFPARAIDLALTGIRRCENARILISPAGHRSTSATSDDVAAEVRELSRSLGDGPWSYDVRSCCSDDLVHDPRWPRFGPAAAEMGVRSLSLVLVRHGATSVELTTCSPTARAFSAKDRVTAMILASVTLVAVRSAAEEGRLDGPADPLLRALENRSIASAVLGTVMEGESIDEPAALHLLATVVATLSTSLSEPDPVGSDTERSNSARLSTRSE